MQHHHFRETLDSPICESELWRSFPQYQGHDLSEGKLTSEPFMALVISPASEWVLGIVKNYLSYTMVLLNTQFWLAWECQLTFDIRTPLEILKQFKLNSLFTLPNYCAAAANDATLEINEKNLNISFPSLSVVLQCDIPWAPQDGTCNTSYKKYLTQVTWTHLSTLQPNKCCLKNLKKTG